MTTTQTTSPTEIDYYASHDTAALRRIVEKYTADSMWIATNHGADHPMSVENMRIANAAWGQLVLRGEA